MNSVKVGLLGLGTVGQGTARVLSDNASEIARRAGRHIQVVSAAVRDVEKAEAQGFNITILTDPQAIVDDPEIDIVCELMGGIDLPLSLVLRAIDNGKHVITANKALIALHGNQIFAAAAKKGVTVAFEPAVAGGIPVIKAIREGLAANNIQWLAGIINGTGNFILTEMRNHGRDFEDVLADAQALGYAEADPTFDVEGIDAAHKLSILASIAFGIPLQFDAVYTEGISEITSKDVAYADELGYSVKHLGIARKSEEGVQMRVHPTLIPKSRLIANVDGVMNAVLVQSDAVGPTLYYGAGAGSDATASAVVADVIDVVRLLSAAPENSVPYLAFQPNELRDLTVLPPEKIVSAYYLRLQAEDKPGVMADVTRILADQGVSLKSILQKKPEGEETAEVILLTHRVEESSMNAAIDQIGALATITDKVQRIRVEALD